MLKTYILIGRDNELNLVAIVKVLIFSVSFNELKLNFVQKGNFNHQATYIQNKCFLIRYVSLKEALKYIFYHSRNHRTELYRA